MSEGEDSLPKEKKGQNLCCHWCRISAKRKRSTGIGYIACPGCRMSFCHFCLKVHMKIDPEEILKDDPEVKNWKCLRCQSKCCCQFSTCAKDHRHCFTYRRTKKRHSQSNELRWSKEKLPLLTDEDEVKIEDGEGDGTPTKRKCTPKKRIKKEVKKQSAKEEKANVQKEKKAKETEEESDEKESDGEVGETPREARKRRREARQNEAKKATEEGCENCEAGEDTPATPKRARREPKKAADTPPQQKKATASPKQPKKSKAEGEHESGDEKEEETTSLHTEGARRSGRRASVSPGKKLPSLKQVTKKASAAKIPPISTIQTTTTTTTTTTMTTNINTNTTNIETNTSSNITINTDLPATTSSTPLLDDLFPDLPPPPPCPYDFHAPPAFDFSGSFSPTSFFPEIVLMPEKKVGKTASASQSNAFIKFV